MLPKDKWLEHLRGLSTARVCWEEPVLKTLPDSEIPAGQEFPVEVENEYKQFYKWKMSGEKLKEDMQPYVPPLLNYQKTLTLHLGIHDQTRTVIGIPINSKEKASFTSALEHYYKGSFFPPLPQESIEVEWKKVVYDPPSTSVEYWYECPQFGHNGESETIRAIDAIFQETRGLFDLYFTIGEKPFIRTTMKLSINPVNPPDYVEKQERYVISIKFNLQSANNPVVYAHTEDVKYWFFNASNHPESMGCFQLWIQLQSSTLDPVTISQLHSHLFIRILRNCTLEEFHKAPYFQNVPINDHNDAFPNSFQNVIIILGLTNPMPPLRTLGIEQLKKDFPTKEIMVFFFVMEIPKVNTFATIQRELKRHQIAWKLLHLSPNFSPGLNLLPMHMVDACNCAWMVTDGTLLPPNLDQLAANYLHGETMLPSEYWDLIENKVIVERDLATNVDFFITTALREPPTKRTTVLTIENRFRGSGATSFLHFLAYKYRRHAACMILKPKPVGNNWNQFLENVKNSRTPMMVFADEGTNCESLRLLQPQQPLILVTIVRRGTNNFAIEPFLKVNEANALIAICKKYFPSSTHVLEELKNKIQTDGVVFDRHIFTIVLAAHRGVYQAISDFVKEEISALKNNAQMVYVLAFLAVYTVKTSSFLPGTSAIQSALLFPNSQHQQSYWHVWLARETLCQLFEEHKSKDKVLEGLLEALLPHLNQYLGTVGKTDYLSDIFFSHTGNDKLSRLYQDLGKEKYTSLLKGADRWFSDIEKYERQKFIAHRTLHESRLLRISQCSSSSLAQKAVDLAREAKLPDFPFLNNLAESLSFDSKFQEADDIFRNLWEKDPKDRTISQALNNAQRMQDSRVIDYWTGLKNQFSPVEIRPFYRQDYASFGLNAELLNALE